MYVYVRTCMEVHMCPCHVYAYVYVFCVRVRVRTYVYSIYRDMVLPRQSLSGGATPRESGLVHTRYCTPVVVSVSCGTRNVRGCDRRETQFCP